MSLYLNHYGWLLKFFYPGLEWRLEHPDQKVLYLTFDDGPVPQATPWVLDTLDEYGIKATFFCVGGNLEKYPELYKDILKRGHRTANHTYNHLNGWNHSDDYYFANIMACESIMEKLEEEVEIPQEWRERRLFRPPYGKIKRIQSDYLQEIYRVVMWDVITGDFDLQRGKEKCLKTALEARRNGSIIIFHDSVKSIANVKYALPKFIEDSLEKGYTFETL
ncbi:MAG: polysaccharide deacetylase family protein [Cytophagaceae bacterium]